MELTFQDKIKRVEIAENLLEYAEMMYDMSRNPQILIKNIFRAKEKENKKNQYSAEKFEQIKKHHFFSVVVSSFSFENDEYITNLSLKNIGIDEKIIQGLFVNKTDINDYKNRMTGNIKEYEILKYIRNALNHHENGILYKYLEEENVIEIDLKDVRSNKEKKQNPSGKPKRFHVKVPVSILVSIMLKFSESEQKNTQFLIVSNDIDYSLLNIEDELKNKLRLLRITIKENSTTKKELEKICKLKGDDLNSALENLKNEGKIDVREYTYKNGAITDWQIDSMCELIKSNEVDWRVKEMNNLISHINQEKGYGALSDDSNAKIAQFLSRRNIFQFGIVSAKRFLSSALFNKVCLKSWNNSFVKNIEKQVSVVENLNDINRFEWFMLDPLEKIFTEYENFIRYAIVNFAPTSPNHIVSFNGKNYDCDFLRNALAHGRVGYVRKNDQYMFALYDCLNGLHNEVSYVNKKLYIPIELVRFAEHLCKEEKKKIEIEQKNFDDKKNKLIELRKNLTSGCSYNINDALESFKFSKK